MKVRYFRDTDTLYIEFKKDRVEESRDLDDNTVIDLDAAGQLCALTLEHASQRTDIPSFSFKEVAA